MNPARVDQPPVAGSWRSRSPTRRTISSKIAPSSGGSRCRRGSDPPKSHRESADRPGEPWGSLCGESCGSERSSRRDLGRLTAASRRSQIAAAASSPGIRRANRCLPAHRCQSVRPYIAASDSDRAPPAAPARSGPKSSVAPGGWLGCRSLPCHVISLSLIGSSPTQLSATITLGHDPLRHPGELQRWVRRIIVHLLKQSLGSAQNGPTVSAPPTIPITTSP